MKIELVVFDLAGTTVKDNQDVHRVLQVALRHAGVDISLEDANEVMGIPKPIAIRQLLEAKGYTPITNDFIDAIHTDFIKEMILFYEADKGVGEKDGVSETFAALKSKGIKVAVDTGFDRKITDAILERMTWKKKNLIDASVTSDEVENGRPYPDLIFEAMKRTGVTDITRVAKVGDTPSDMQEGTRAGCTWVVGITSGAFAKEELEREPHTHLISSIEELLPLVGAK